MSEEEKESAKARGMEMWEQKKLNATPEELVKMEQME